MNEVNVNFEEIIALAKTELSKNKTQNYDLNVLTAGSTDVGKALEKDMEMMSKDEFEKAIC